MPHPTSTVLITGGHGFIGSHVAKRLHDEFPNYRVKIVDINPISPFGDVPLCHDFIHGNLCDFWTCVTALRGVDIIMHFAATMGGMGTIHAANDSVIYEQNHAMVQNLLKVISMPDNTVSRFLYASSACVYPEALQSSNQDISLREDSVFSSGTPVPQGLYGLEKLNSELLLTQYSDRIEVRIARFHNVFGPGGAWKNGREKAPAAFLRKTLASSCLIEEFGDQPNFEIWGDGTQRRSFLYIDDAIDATLRLLFSSCTAPMNIGSDRSITISQLADIALKCAGSDSQVTFTYDLAKPLGVVSRNSNNEYAQSSLGWKPTTSLEDGMSKTFSWLQTEMAEFSSAYTDPQSRRKALHSLLSSRLVNLATEGITYAILLPITSRGSDDPSVCLRNLRNFIISFRETTWRDTNPLSSPTYTYKIYLAIDEDDHFLRHDNVAYQVLLDAGIPESYIHIVLCDFPKGHICSIWRDCARKAYEDNCDYYVLVGDDVIIEDEGWMRKADDEFASIAQSRRLPHGIGCVAFTDQSFPGMPTFPIIHKTHMDVFNGQVIPDVFINQDGDPFLFQLYRRWGASVMFPCRLTNGIGGSVNARYTKQHVRDWSLELLATASHTISLFLCNTHGFDTTQVSHYQKTTIDIIIPCYRVSLPILEKILSLDAPDNVSLNHIVIVDNPESPDLPTLLHTHSAYPCIRIRVNDKNRGAPYSRNRGLLESSADWVHFLDDDVIPAPNLIHELSKYININPMAAGFVCNTQFPPSHSIFTTAVHLAGVTYFWDIATKLEVDIPWGVTANLVSRRSLLSWTDSPPTVAEDRQKTGSQNSYNRVLTSVPVTQFSLVYPKTGGGEDIDYCLKQREASLSLPCPFVSPSIVPAPAPVPPTENELDEENASIISTRTLLAAPTVTVTHPWWNSGRRSYWRFYLWSVGDGHLISAYPHLSYWDYSPNSAECIALALLTAVIPSQNLETIQFAAELCLMTMIANVIHDLWRHLVRHPERTEAMKTTLRRGGFRWVFAVVESSFIRMFSEFGRFRGVVGRREWGSLGRRFDWFSGKVGNGPRMEERRNSVERFVLIFILMLAWKML